MPRTRPPPTLAPPTSPPARELLTTIQADWDGIIRADSRRALMVVGGIGHGKTETALGGQRICYGRRSLDPRALRLAQGHYYLS